MHMISQILSGADTTAISTIHNTLGMQEESKEKLVQWLQRRLAGQSDQFVAVSEGVAKSIVEHVGVDREKVSVLHNPIPVDEVQERAGKPVDHPWIESANIDVVLGVGRWRERRTLDRSSALSNRSMPLDRTRVRLLSAAGRSEANSKPSRPS